MLLISNATVVFGNKKKALDNLSLNIQPGEFVVVLGNNGAGKSTLLNLIAGDIKPNMGSITLKDTDVTTWPSYQRAKWAAKVLQNPGQATVGSLTIAENLAFAYLRGQKRLFDMNNTKARRNLFIEKLEELDMDLENRLDDLASELSGGQRQALSLVMATLSGSELLLLDEHTSALDPKTAAAIMVMTDRLIRQNGLTALMITHDMNDALQYGDRTLFLAEGKIVRELLASNRNGLVQADLVQYF